LLDPSYVPNTVLAKTHERHHIRVFFPGLTSKERKSSALTASESEIVYSRGILPAIDQVANSIAHHFPPSYSSETFRATLRTGAQIQSTFPISGHDIRPFSQAFREQMSNVTWGKDLVFCTELRGIKNSTEHDPTQNDANHELEHLFRSFNQGGTNVEGDWYVDVALELLHKDMAVVWRADCYRPIMTELLRFNQCETNQTISKKRLFEIDINQHLTQVAGFRAICKKPTGPHEVVYVQAYTTDKALTYQPENGNFGKTLSARLAMEGEGEGPSYTNRLLDAYLEARARTDVAARLEVRVPVHHAAHVLLDFPRELYSQTTLVFPRQLWW
jgi:hypothetical protein